MKISLTSHDIEVWVNYDEAEALGLHYPWWSKDDDYRAEFTLHDVILALAKKLGPDNE